MICLGIEATAHTFGAALVSSKGEILSDVRDMYKTESGGIIPIEAGRHHDEVADKVVQEAIQQSKSKKIDLISYSAGPGLGPCLRSGLNKAIQLAKDLNVPLIGINHCIAHLTSGQLFTKLKNPVFLYTSGANTQIISLEGDKFRIFGETLDLGLGNALDKFGRIIGLGFPSGQEIEKLAKEGKYIELPYTVKGMDISLSGILTDCINKFNKGIKKEDLCYSLQETVFAMLTETTERALAHCNKKEVLLIGGVAANKRFCEMLDSMCKQRGAIFKAVPMKYAGDNAVQISWQGLLEYNAGRRENIEKANIRPYERTDDVKVFWKRSDTI